MSYAWWTFLPPQILRPHIRVGPVGSSPTANNTLAAFQALRKQCLDLEAAFIAAHTNWRTQSEMMNQQAAVLHEANTAWYAAATRLFAIGTAEGDMIRRSSPTIHSQTPAPAPAPAPVKTATQGA
ncbi:MAG: hypothetical protein ABSH28_16525 [Acidobacteriota bacterium]